jgi:signal transduction histidine kinase
MSDAQEERKFLHDLATPLSVALGMAESALDQITKGAVADEAQLKKLQDRVQKSQTAVLRCVELLKERRQILISRQQASATD